VPRGLGGDSDHHNAGILRGAMTPGSAFHACLQTTETPSGVSILEVSTTIWLTVRITLWRKLDISGGCTSDYWMAFPLPLTSCSAAPSGTLGALRLLSFSSDSCTPRAIYATTDRLVFLCPTVKLIVFQTHINDTSLNHFDHM
jgi:hypothetical protein